MVLENQPALVVLGSLSLLQPLEDQLVLQVLTGQERRMVLGSLLVLDYPGYLLSLGCRWVLGHLWPR